MDTTTQPAFDFLRVSIESRLSGPSTIAITSALADDGTTIVAAGLAEAFADAGQSTLLISTHARSIGTLNGRRFEPPAAAVRGVRGDGRANLAKATADQLTADVRGGRAALAGVVASLRKKYAVIVIDAEPIPNSSVAYELARQADAVLVAVRLGRKPSREDQTTMKLLDECKANVLGVVPTSARITAAQHAEPPLEPVAEVDPFALRAKRQVEAGR